MVPKTHLGRFVSFVASLFGSFMLSMFIISLTNTLNMKKNECRLYKTLANKEFNEENNVGFLAKIFKKKSKPGP